ncbi:MAG: Mini-ribonuclease 3 [Clostridia bacterium]|nr:Mini-ribonuclease 3 [Clostridia bacterium]
MINFDLSNIKEKDLTLISPLVLAYIGDAVFEVFVRTKVVNDGYIKTSKLHTLATGFVKAKAQADALDRIYENLTHEEQEIIRRGRNADSKTIPKNASVADYKKATALEALIGYLFLLKNDDRLNEVIDMILGG